MFKKWKLYACVAVFVVLGIGGKFYFDARCKSVDFDRAVITSYGLECEWQGWLHRAMP